MDQRYRALYTDFVLHLPWSPVGDGPAPETEADRIIPKLDGAIAVVDADELLAGTRDEIFERAALAKARALGIPDSVATPVVEDLVDEVDDILDFEYSGPSMSYSDGLRAEVPVSLHAEFTALNRKITLDTHSVPLLMEQELDDGEYEFTVEDDVGRWLDAVVDTILG
jgi:hypothetical protein